MKRKTTNAMTINEIGLTVLWFYMNGKRMNNMFERTKPIEDIR